jgi:hypothetical protein
VPLTPNQLTALKADILADPAFTTGSPALKDTPDGRFAIAAAYNLPAALDFWVWRTYITKNEIVSSTTTDGTTWTWVGNGFITRSAGEQAAWTELFNASGSINASLPQVRAAFGDILSGAGNAAANRTHLLTVARRKATRAEKLFASGSGTTGTPGTMTFEGAITFTDVDSALNLL